MRRPLDGGYLFSASHTERRWQKLQTPNLRRITSIASALNAVERLVAPKLRHISLLKAESSEGSMKRLRYIIESDRFPCLCSINYGLVAPDSNMSFHFEGCWGMLKRACETRDVTLILATLEVTSSHIGPSVLIRSAIGGCMRDLRSLEVDLDTRTHASSPPRIHLSALLDLSLHVKTAGPSSRILADESCICFLRAVDAPTLKTLELQIWRTTPILLRELQSWILERRRSQNLTTLLLVTGVLSGWSTRAGASSALRNFEDALNSASVYLKTMFASSGNTSTAVYEIEIGGQVTGPWL